MTSSIEIIPPSKVLPSKNGAERAKRLPPPSNADASAPVENTFKRFTKLTGAYDRMEDLYRKLYRASLAPHLFDMHSDTVKDLVVELSNGDDAKFKALWPGVDIHRPSRKHLAERLSLLVGSFPNAAPHSPQVYAHTMLEHIEAEEPSAMVLESTCRELVETKKFVPAISEVLKVLREQKKKWEKRLAVHEAVRSGRVKQLSEKLIAGLQRREQGLRPDYEITPQSQQLPGRYDHPDWHELEQIERQYDKAWNSVPERRRREFRGLNDEVIKQLQAELKVERLLEKRSSARDDENQDDLE